MPLPLALIGEGLLAAAPLIMQYFSGDDGDAEAGAKIKQMRDGLAARLSEGQRIPLAKAQAMVDEQLKPMIEQHAQDAGSKGAGLAAGAASAVGGVLLGRRLGGMSKLAKGAKAAVGAEKAAVAAAPIAAAEAAAPAAAKAAAATEAEVAAAGNPAAYAHGAEPADGLVPEGVYTARAAGNDAQMARASTGEMDRVSPARRRGQRPRLGYSGDPIRTVDAELMPPEVPDNTPPNMAGMREYTIPTDRFTMRDPDEDGLMGEVMRRLAMRRIGG